MKTLTLSIADKDYEIRSLTVEQVETIQEVLLAGAAKVTANRAILAAALSADHPDMTVAALGKVRLGSVRRLDVLVRSVLEFAEFVGPEAKKADGDAPVGEAAGE